MRRPTRIERDNAAAWLSYNARVHAQANAMLRTLLAVVIAVLLTLALLHWATPCAEAALCLAPATVPRGLIVWCRRTFRRLHIQVLRVRLQQLLGSAQQMALDRHQPPDAALRLGAVLARAAAVRLQLAQLEQAARADHVARAARA